VACAVEVHRSLVAVVDHLELLVGCLGFVDDVAAGVESERGAARRGEEHERHGEDGDGRSPGWSREVEHEGRGDEREAEQQPDAVDGECRNENERRRPGTQNAPDGAQRVNVARGLANALLRGEFGGVGTDEPQEVRRWSEQDDDRRQ